MQTARVYLTNGNQTVQIPQEYHFAGEEVYINQVGDSLIITPVHKLKSVYNAGLAGFTDDFMAAGRPGNHTAGKEFDAS